jgi:acetyl-CoA synthetase
MGDSPKFFESPSCHSPGSITVSNKEEYENLYGQSLGNSERFWPTAARRYLCWQKEWDSVLSYDAEEISAQWFSGAVLNACYNCVDRHFEMDPQKAAFLVEGQDGRKTETVTYQDLYERVNEFAAVLKGRGIRRGDVVVIYLPNVIELPVAMLACSRIGAVHCAVSCGYSIKALEETIIACSAKALVSTDTAIYGDRAVHIMHSLKETAERCPHLETVIMLTDGGDKPEDLPKPFFSLNSLVKDLGHRTFVQPEPMGAEDPLFIIFSGGAIGKQRPLVYTHGGYLVWAAFSVSFVFSICQKEILWCTSDIPWITGHTLGVYAPLLLGVTSVLFEGSPFFPNHQRIWEIVEKSKVSVFCAEPRLIQKLSQSSGTNPTGYDLSSLRVLGSAPRPLPVAASQWYSENVGNFELPVVGTWWQTETGGPMIATLPNLGSWEHGCAGLPVLGVDPVILDLDTAEAVRYPNQEGAFFIGHPWPPGMVNSIFSDHDAFREVYSAPFGGLFTTGEGAKKDSHGRYWMTGRIDDVIDVGGNRFGAWEIESAIVTNPRVAEAVVVPFPHPEKIQGIYCFVSLTPGSAKSDQLKEEIRRDLEREIGLLVEPDVIHLADSLPKTRSGKILRGILQKIAAGQIHNLGDLSTVANPETVTALISSRTSEIRN